MILLLTLLIVLTLTACNIKGKQEEPLQESGLGQSQPEELLVEEQTPRIEEISMAAVGDIMVHSPQFESAYVGGEQGYDFYPVFQPIEKYIKQVDIAVGNLETTLAGEEKGYTGYPEFNSPEQLAEALKLSGFDVITTANNHSLDRRNFGVRSTLDFLDQQGLSHTGTARSQEERDTILIKNVKDVEIAFLSYTYGTNGIPLPEEAPYAVNLIDKEQIKRDIQQAKNQKVDIIVASMHFGNEYQRTESQEQRDLVEFLLEQGVDVILGSHPHVIQPMEIRKVTTVDGEEKECFLIYSMGNFVSNQRDRYRDAGIILQIFFEKNFETNKTTLQKVEYVPTWVDKSNIGGKISYHIVSIEQAIQEYENNQSETISQENYQSLQQTWEDTTGHLKQENTKINVKSLVD